MYNFNDIRENLKFLRTDFNYTQEELSIKTNMTISTISRLENNARNIQIDELITILNVYDMSINAFFEVIEIRKLKQKNYSKSFLKIMKHFSKYTNAEIHLIEEDIMLFKKLFLNMEQNQLYNNNINLLWYLQLPRIYPEYFPEINKQALIKHIDTLFKKTIFTNDDYVYLALTIPFLDKNSIEKITPFILNLDLETILDHQKRAIQVIFVNITDYHLVNYNLYTTKELKTNLDNLFNKWEKFLNMYVMLENQLLYFHNKDMSKLLLKTENKEIITQKCKNRSIFLNNLEFKYHSELLKNESTKYAKNILGILDFNISM